MKAGQPREQRTLENHSSKTQSVSVSNKSNTDRQTMQNHPTKPNPRNLFNIHIFSTCQMHSREHQFYLDLHLGKKTKNPKDLQLRLKCLPNEANSACLICSSSKWNLASLLCWSSIVCFCSSSESLRTRKTLGALRFVV